MRWAPLVLTLTACATDPSADMAGDGDGKADSFDSSAATKRENAVTDLLAGVQGDEAALRAWLLPMPKGGDLHSHLSGAVPTESLISWGAADGNCVSADGTSSAGPTCMTGAQPMAGLDESDALWTTLVQTWSLGGHHTDPVTVRHDRFFGAFAKFFSVTRKRNVDMLVEARRTAARDHVSYVELMIGLGTSTGGRVGQRHLTPAGAWDEAALAAGRTAILADNEIDTTIARTKTDLDNWQHDMDVMLGCNGASPEPACDVEVRYLAQAVRAQPREHVFGQFVYGFALAHADSRVVGVNLVQAEEDPTSLASYRDHMKAIGYLTKADKDVKVSLHAGELTDAFSTAEHMKFHVYDAVMVAGASRIGHAVDILGEDNADTLLNTMAQRGVLVEACLTSNQQLLDIEGDDHPIAKLLSKGVPVALATDDQGILRTSMTDELVRAVTAQGLDYHRLKKMVRASLANSFLPGKRLRELTKCKASLKAEKLDAACETALATSERARREWALEVALDAFETALVP